MNNPFTFLRMLFTDDPELKEIILTGKIKSVMRSASRKQKKADEEIARLEARAEKLRLRSKMSRDEADRLMKTIKETNEAEIAHIEEHLTPKLKGEAPAAFDGLPDESAAERFDKKKKARRGKSIYSQFCATSVVAIEDALSEADTTQEKEFYRQLLNLKLRTEQEKVIGEVLY